MLGPIYIGLSGMQAYAKGLQTISNNVANLDTLGYKASTISFSDVFGEGGNGLSYTSGQGGTTGNGVQYDLDRTDFTQGTLQQTGGGLDLAIQGDGFLVVQNDNGDTFYTRTGQFSVDSKGYISNQNGDRLTILDSSNQPQTVNVNDHLTSAPVATTNVAFTNIIDSSTTATSPATANITVYDSIGAAHTWKISVAPATTTDTTAAKQWTVTVTEGTVPVGTGTVAFGSNGNSVSPSSFTINSTPTDANAMAVTLDFGKAQVLSNGTSTLTGKPDGYAVGSLTSAKVNANGEMVLTYSNSQTTTLGAISIADFQDQQQLVRVGGGLFKNSGTGQFQYTTSGANGIGTLQTGQVEASNVNLTSEFGNLILIQRGFDASSQVISASNDMIQQLFGMRGHG